MMGEEGVDAMWRGYHDVPDTGFSVLATGTMNRNRRTHGKISTVYGKASLSFITSFFGPSLSLIGGVL